MGILLIPFLIAAFVVFILSAKQVLKAGKNKELNSGSFIKGLFITIAIYCLVLLSYIGSNQYWVFGPFFSFPIFMLFLPFVVAYLLSKSNSGNSIRNNLFISIVISGILVVVCNSMVFDYLNRIGITPHY